MHIYIYIYIYIYILYLYQYTYKHKRTYIHIYIYIQSSPHNLNPVSMNFRFIPNFLGSPHRDKTKYLKGKYPLIRKIELPKQTIPKRTITSNKQVIFCASYYLLLFKSHGGISNEKAGEFFLLFFFVFSCDRNLFSSSYSDSKKFLETFFHHL